MEMFSTSAAEISGHWPYRAIKHLHVASVTEALTLCFIILKLN